MKHHQGYLRWLVSKGGPSEEDYYDLDAWIIEVSEQVRQGRISEQEKAGLIELFGPAFSPATMQGFAYCKPHGYAGDFEIIDRIYQGYVAEHQDLSNWDVYWQGHAAADAVRNRVDYLHRLIDARAPGRVRVLNLASGPGRDMLGYFRHASRQDVHFDCVEQDPNAVEHAKDLCRDHLDRIRFINKNALRFTADRQYDLIWSAGLFDYFEDKTFVALLKRLRPMLAGNGELVIGNFSTKNPSRPYMDLFGWHLFHRSPLTLKHLAQQAGMAAEDIEVRREASGVNLFLHYRQGASDGPVECAAVGR